jgi:hypothetical protein
MANQIRNIAQTVQEREIIKTAPDVVIYVEGRPYLINPYINLKSSKNQSDGQYTIVPFNDYVDSFTVAYQVDNLIPSGSFTMSVPAAQKYLFLAPGGNNIIEPMQQVQVFAKGYFPSQNGNTLYYRVFKGLISSVSHSDTGTSVQISVSCLGMLHFLDLMYVDLSPANMTNSPLGPTAFSTNQYSMNPYQMLADTFLRAVTPEGFQLASIQQDNIQNNTSDWADAVKAGYINRWQIILTNIMRDVRILGYAVQDATKTNPTGTELEGYDPSLYHETFTKESDDALGQMALNMRSAQNSRVPQKSVIDQKNDASFYVDIMRKYLPDYSIGNLQLIGGKIVSRTERLRTVVNLIAYEGYQDLDGAIIFKPPFYNLDVNNDNLGTLPNLSGTATSGTSGALSAASYIRPNANPFVVYLSEIENETETEDEGNVRATRMQIQPDWLSEFHGLGDSSNILPIADHIDIPKLAKFGLREQPPRQLSYLAAGDKLYMYAYAVSELNRANRGYRTYSFTIPIRPELRLGFPMYIPHRDMYGYINSINISYQQAGTATMHITLDTLRKRLLVPGYTDITDEKGQQKKVITYQSQPNLVMQWTVPPGSSPNPTPATPATPPPLPATVVPATGGYSNPAASKGGTGASVVGKISSNPVVNQVNNPATIPQVEKTPFHPQEWEYIMHQKEKLGSLFATRFDTKTKSFRVQNDKATADDAKGIADSGSTSSTGIQVGQPFFSKDNWGEGINIWYYHKILTTQPYTDEKGYEVITPFPWGRWQDVNTAIRESRLGILSNTANIQGAGNVQAMNVFLFAGLATPNSGDITTALNTALSSGLGVTVNGLPATGYDSVELDSVIELVTPQPGDVGSDDALTNYTQPDMQKQSAISDITNIQQRINTFITGGATLPDSQPLKGAKSIVTPSPTAPALRTPGAPFTIPAAEPGSGDEPIAG